MGWELESEGEALEKACYSCAGQKKQLKNSQQDRLFSLAIYFLFFFAMEKEEEWLEGK